MKTLNLQKAIIDGLKDLPHEKLKEVADFISSLHTKSPENKSPQKSSVYKYSSELSNEETKHLEEEFVDYKKLYPRE